MRVCVRSDSKLVPGALRFRLPRRESTATQRPTSLPSTSSQASAADFGGAVQHMQTSSMRQARKWRISAQLRTIWTCLLQGVSGSSCLHSVVCCVFRTVLAYISVVFCTYKIKIILTWLIADLVWLTTPGQEDWVAGLRGGSWLRHGPPRICRTDTHVIEVKILGYFTVFHLLMSCCFCCNSVNQ